MTQPVEHIESSHPFQDVAIVGRTFDATSPRLVVTVTPQPGRVLFQHASVLVQECVFDGLGMASGEQHLTVRHIGIGRAK